MFEYTSETVSYAEELTSVPICYSQGDGFNTTLSRLFYILHTQPHLVVVMFSRCPVVRSCTTSGNVNKYVCTLPTSPGMNRPPHLGHHAHASLELQMLFNTPITPWHPWKVLSELIMEAFTQIPLVAPSLTFERDNGTF